MKAIYLPESGIIFTAIPLYQRWEHETTTETNGYAVVLKTFEDKPLAYCIAGKKQSFVMGFQHYQNLVNGGHIIELGDM